MATIVSHTAYFRAIPWCERLISDPKYEIRDNPNRTPKPDTEDSFIAETLKTPLTVYADLTLAARPTAPAPMPIREVNTLFALGSGLNGHAGIAHGGFLVSLFDEGMSLLLGYNKELQARDSPRPASSTASMKVDYKLPVKTPQVVLLRAWLREARGRKYYIDAVLEDGEGRTLAVGSSLWISSVPINAAPKL